MGVTDVAEKPRGGQQRGELPIGPLQDWIKHRLTVEGLWDPERGELRTFRRYEAPAHTLADICAAWGVSMKLLYDYLHGRRDGVREETADRFFTGAGEPYQLQECYPQLYEW